MGGRQRKGEEREREREENKERKNKRLKIIARRENKKTECSERALARDRKGGEGTDVRRKDTIHEEEERIRIEKS